jgi:hypothetical protein
MPTPQTSLLWTSWLPAAVALLVVWLTSRLASIRAHDDRVWDRKAGAYSAIFEALFDMEMFFDKHLEDHMNGRDISSDESQALYQAYSAARKRVGQILAREAWLLSDAVRAEKDKLNTELAKRGKDWFDDMDSGCAAVIAARKAIAQLASDDLRRPRLLPSVRAFFR